MLHGLWETQWTTRWAAENTVCAYGCNRESYKDQELHYEDCDFVALWTDLMDVRVYALHPNNHQVSHDPASGRPVMEILEVHPVRKKRA
jgi:hypothetical protein